MHISDITVRQLKPPPKGQKTYFDDGLKGFGVRVSQGGTKTFVLMYGNDRKLTTIGRVGVVKLKDDGIRPRTSSPSISSTVMPRRASRLMRR